MRNTKQKTIIALVTSMVLFGNAYGEEVTLKDIEVTATKTSKHLLEISPSVSVVTSEEITKSGKNTVAELLRDIPAQKLNNIYSIDF